MVKVFRASEVEPKGRRGYTAKYIARPEFKGAISNAAFILVKIDKGTKTRPHAHENLEEAFLIISEMKFGIDDNILSLRSGDIVIAEPGEFHWFQAPIDKPASMFAVKLPNVEDDKIEKD